MSMIFPSFFDKPKKIRFLEQEDDEQIELVLRQHWITNVPWIFISIALITLPFFLSVFNLGEFFSFGSIPGDILVAGLILWYLGILAYVVEKFLYWYFNIYIVTDHHLVDINFHNITNRDITEVELGDIQSVSSGITGVIRSLFHFGNVVVETSAKMQDITFADVPKPDLVRDRIQDLQALKTHHPSIGGH